MNSILSALEQLGRQIRGEEECDDLPNMPPEPMAIPRELEDAFSSIAQGLFQNLLAIPLDRGIDAAVFCFTRITKLSDQLDQSEFKYLTTIINTLEATWILRTIKSGQHYQNALQYYSPNPVEQQLGRWGMTTERFCNRFEEVISITEISRLICFLHFVHRICMKHLGIFLVATYYFRQHQTCLKYSRRKDECCRVPR